MNKPYVVIPGITLNSPNSKETHESTLDESKDFGTIESKDNNIYFYAEVDRNSVLSLVRKVDELNKTYTALKINHKWLEYPKINLHINSYGGFLLDGFTAVNCVRTSKAPIITIIDGYAASAATLISVAGKERYMHEHSFVLIHQLSSWFAGKYEEFKDHMKNTEMEMTVIYKIYEEHTKIPSKKIKELLKKDVWFTPKECLEYGIVDDILTAV